MKHATIKTMRFHFLKKAVSSWLVAEQGSYFSMGNSHKRILFRIIKQNGIKNPKKNILKSTPRSTILEINANKIILKKTNEKYKKCLIILTAFSK
jgi:hypothetical protein